MDYQKKTYEVWINLDGTRKVAMNYATMKDALELMRIFKKEVAKIEGGWFLEKIRKKEPNTTEWMIRTKECETPARAGITTVLVDNTNNKKSTKKRS